VPGILPGITNAMTVKDVLVEDAGPVKLFEQFTATALWKAGDAHHSYWESKSVAKAIADQIIAVDSRPLHRLNLNLRLRPAS
ncbi:MAG TPA: hypothetical protein V6C72_05015, partial [Chroococcales cyanobacterium]